ncbi:hypothetical protein [Streptomyces mirabilis]|uniref:hypothetical protein n=1 Tax=Streptomyces mirabilis TaxID=68239 RepID=UPI0036DDD4EB
MQKAPDVVEAAECPTVHVRSISPAQTGRPKQRAAGHSPRSDLHAPVLDELPVVVVQGAPDQNARRLGLMRLVPERPLQRPRTQERRCSSRAWNNRPSAV